MDRRMKYFKLSLEQQVLNHPVLTANPYTAWFRRGEFNVAQARAFLIQFSVFSNQFLVAQLQKVLNADTIEEMRASKEILANEIGVGFRGAGPVTDSELGDPDGSIEGGTFRFRAAHFELLVRMANQFGLSFADLGKRRFGTESTLFFCDELIRLYANEDYAVSAAASWAVENWAAAGFWNELVTGWRNYAERQGIRRLNMGFFTWHARLEANHAQHTWAELETICAHQDVDEAAFIEYANEMLDGVSVFWRGLDQQRRALAGETKHANAG